MAVVERNPFSVIPGGAVGGPNPSIQESDIEIELEDPDAAVEMGFQDIGDDQALMEAQQDHYANLAELLSDEELQDIGEKVADAYEADKESRAEWESTFERGFDLLGLKLQETTEPFEGSCTAVSPLIIESAVKFQSKATIELFPAGGPVRTQIIGSTSPEREDQANRVQNFMNYQLTEQITEYFDEFETMLFHLPLIGSAFKKMYYDPSIRRPCSEFVPVDQFYVSYHASDLQKAERYTHVIYRSPVEMDRDVASGMYMDADLQEATAPDPNSFTSKIDSIMGIGPAENYDQQYTILEQHCHMDLPEPFDSPDEVALPYVITVEEESRKVISIRRNWSKEDPTQSKQTYFTHYKFVPGFGFYGLGLIHLLGNMTMSATSALRSLVDAGQFSNLPGGFKARGVRVVGGNDPIAPGEFREVEATGLDLQKSIVPLPYKEPSQTLYNMLNWLTTAGQKFADQTEQIVNESSNYGPVGTTMALIESSAKFFSAIHKRLHKSQRDEFRLLAKINHEFLPDEYPYDVPNITSSVFKSDFDGRVDVIPVSDPNVPSAAHRLSMAQMVLQLSSQAPQGLYNVENVHLSILKAANIQNPERFFTPKTPPEPHDPITDIQMVVKGMPIQAFPQQDHAAHIAIKTAFIDDPTLGKTEMMAPAIPVLQANIQQHMVMQYQEQMSGMVKLELQQMGQQPDQVSPEVLSQLSINAAEKILEASSGEGGESFEKQNIMLEGARLDLEQQKMQLGATKDAAELAIRNRELDLKEMGVELTAATKVADKNQKQMDARVREDDSIRGTNTQIIIESLRNLVREREMMMKKRESEKRYAQGGSVGFQGGGALFEKFVEDRGGQAAFEPGYLEEILAKIGGGRQRTGSEIIQDTWFNYKRELQDSQNPFDHDRLAEIEKQEKAFKEKKATEPVVADLDLPDVAATTMFNLPPETAQAAPRIPVERSDLSSPIKDEVQQEIIKTEDLDKVAPDLDKVAPLASPEQRVSINKETIEEVSEPEAKGPEHMPRSSNEIQDAFMESFYERAGIIPDADSRASFMDGLKKYEDITGIRESGGNLLATNTDKPQHTATGKWQATNANRRTNSRRIINMMGGAHNVPEWVKQGAQDMSADEHRKFMQGLNEDQQRMLFISQLFMQKGSDDLIKNAMESGWDEDSLTDLYMKTHHLGKGKQKKTATGVPISDLFRADFRRYSGILDK